MWSRHFAVIGLLALPALASACGAAEDEGVAARDASFGATTVPVRYDLNPALPKRTKLVAEWESRDLAANVSAVVEGGSPEGLLWVVGDEGRRTATIGFDYYSAGALIDSLVGLSSRRQVARPGETVEYDLPIVLGRSGQGMMLSRGFVATNGVLSFSVRFLNDTGLPLDVHLPATQMLTLARHMAAAVDSADAMAVTDSTVAYEPLGRRIPP